MRWDGTPHKQSCVDCIYAGKIELGKVYCMKNKWEVEPCYDERGNVVGFCEADVCSFYRRRKEVRE